MDGLIPILVLLILGVPACLAIWLIVRAIQSSGRIEELSRRIQHLEIEIVRLREQPTSPPAAPAETEAASSSEAAPEAPPSSVEILLQRHETPPTIPPP